MSNTKEQGALSFFIFFDNKEKEYAGFCIELGILKFGSSLAQVREDLQNAAKGYVETVVKHNLSVALLSDHNIPDEYKQIYQSYIKFLGQELLLYSQRVSTYSRDIDRRVSDPQVFTTLVHA